APALLVEKPDEHRVLVSKTLPKYLQRIHLSAEGKKRTAQRHEQVINGHLRRLLRIVNVTGSPIYDFEYHPYVNRFFQIHNTDDWNEIKEDFLDLLNEFGMLALDCENQVRDPDWAKPVLVLLGVPSMYLAFWTKRNSKTCAVEDLPKEVVQIIQSPFYIKIGAGIVKDFSKMGMRTAYPYMDVVDFWNVNEARGFLPKRGIPSSLGWLNSKIHQNPFVDHKPRPQDRFLERHKAELPDGITEWSRWRKYSLLYNFLEHRLDNPVPCGYCVFDLHVPFSIIAFSLMRRLEKDDGDYFGFGLSELLFEQVKEFVEEGRFETDQYRPESAEETEQD